MHRPRYDLRTQAWKARVLPINTNGAFNIYETRRSTN